MKKTRSLQKQKNTLPATTGVLNDLREMIARIREQVAVTVNSSLTLLYWHVGNRIRQEILKEKRAEYGQSIVVSLSQQLVTEYGSGFSKVNLHRMVKFAEVFLDEQIVSTLSQQLSWSHFVTIIYLKEHLKRDFFVFFCRIEKWNVRTLRKKIDSMLYERTAISRKPELVAQAELEMLRNEDQLTPNLVFQDPYVLEFLNLNGCETAY